MNDGSHCIHEEGALGKLVAQARDAEDERGQAFEGRVAGLERWVRAKVRVMGLHPGGVPSSVFLSV